MLHSCTFCAFFFFNDTATTEIYTLSLHDALPICASLRQESGPRIPVTPGSTASSGSRTSSRISSEVTDARSECLRWMSCVRSEEHTSELQSRQYLVCRLLLEKKKNRKNYP